MYDKIARVMNRDYGSSDLSAEEVEQYLRHGTKAFISDEEAVLIDELVERYL